MGLIESNRTKCALVIESNQIVANGMLRHNRIEPNRISALIESNRKSIIEFHPIIESNRIEKKAKKEPLG